MKVGDTETPDSGGKEVSSERSHGVHVAIQR